MKTVIYFLLSALCFLTSYSSKAVALDSIQLQLRWHHQFQFAGYYMAQEKGFYQAENLQVTIVEGGTGKNPVGEVLSGQSQYGVGNVEVLTHHQKGEPLVALAAIFQNSPSLLLVRKDSDIYSPRYLKGKRVMLYPGHHDPEILAMLYQQGITDDMIVRQSSSKNIDDLINQKTDAFNAYLTNEPFYLEERGIQYRTINPRDYGVHFYSDILFTTQAELKQNPLRVEAFRRASIKGWEYALDHPEEAIRLLIEKYNVQKSLNHLRYESNLVREMVLPNMVELGYMNRKRWELIAQQLSNLGIIPETYSLSGFLYDEQRDLGWSFWKPWLYGGSIAFILVCLFAFELIRHNRILRYEVSRRKQAEAEALKLAQHDSLTGLPNRKLLETRLERVCQRIAQTGETSAVLFIDLDGFKHVNDFCGHDIGDEALCDSAKRMQSLLQDCGTLARVGGDEFVAILENCQSADQVDFVAKRLLSIIQDDVCYGDNCQEITPISASIGITLMQAGDTPAQVLKRADQAMYSVKRNGKSGTQHHPGTTQDDSVVAEIY